MISFFFRKDRLGGKAGGVAWFSRKKHAGLVREYSTNIPGVLVLEVDFTRQGSFRMFLVGVYFPPAGPTSSSRVAQQERADISHELPLLLARLKQLGVILLVGDTNARVGNSCDGKFLQAMFDSDGEMALDQRLLNQDGLQTKPRTQNEDPVVNSNGEEILMWARGADLWILNGRCIPNQCTYFSNRGSSNCDTWLGSDEILQAAVEGNVSEPFEQSDHAMLTLNVSFPLEQNFVDGVLGFVLEHNLRKPVWKMRRRPITTTLDNEQLLQQLVVEYNSNLAIQETSQRMKHILEAGPSTDPKVAENCIRDFLSALESLSVVQWHSSDVLSGKQRTELLNKPPNVLLAEYNFARHKRLWRRLCKGHPTEPTVRQNMLRAKTVLCRLRRRQRQAYQRGTWDMVARLREKGNTELMWRKIKQQPSQNLGNGTLHMLEQGVKEVAQRGFPHDEQTSAAWAEEFSHFSCPPEPVPDGILQSRELWKLKRGKAVGEDGWCEEFLMLFVKMGEAPFNDLQNAFHLMAMFARIPKYQRGSLIKPVLKPGKKGESHNEYRKLSLMSVLRKKLEKMGSLMMRPYWSAGDYQAGFRKHKRASSRIFILLAVLSRALGPLRNPLVQECGVLLVDFEQFFDTLRPERLFKKMLQVGIPNSVIALWKELVRTHSVKVCFAGSLGKPIRVLVGIPQGSAWSPELATLYTDVGLADGLRTVQTGVVDIGGCPVHLLMYADDLLTVNTCLSGIQEQFDQLEKVSEEDGLRVSYGKTLLAVFRKEGHTGPRWEINGRRGQIREQPVALVKYLGFCADATGYHSHLEQLARRVTAAAGTCIQYFSEYPLMTMAMRRDIFIAKVRSIALFGADVWGWTRTPQIAKAEDKALCVLLRAHARTKPDAMRWLIGILPIWVEAAKLAFGFFISLLEYGDTLEQAALQHWKHMFEEHRTGWFHEMVSFFDTIGILEDMGGASAILTWNTAMARDWQQPLANRCKDIACRNLRSSLEGGKYDFLLSMIPTFDSPRPLAVSVGSTGGKSLYRWMLSSHSLEVETGRYERIPRQERFCKCCWKLVFWNVLGDEFHSLTDCARGEVTRINCLDRLCEIFGSENAMTIFDAIPSLPSKSGVQQKMFWKHLGTVTSSVDRAILHERLVSLQVPDRWMTLMRSAQIQIIRETAERRFRKKLRRQMRNTTWIISSSDSDDDEVIFVSHAPGRSEGGLNP
jgi:hypothetical protein